MNQLKIFKFFHIAFKYSSQYSISWLVLFSYLAAVTLSTVTKKGVPAFTSVNNENSALHFKILTVIFWLEWLIKDYQILTGTLSRIEWANQNSNLVQSATLKSAMSFYMPWSSTLQSNNAGYHTSFFVTMFAWIKQWFLLMFSHPCVPRFDFSAQVQIDFSTKDYISGLTEPTGH